MVPIHILSVHHASDTWAKIQRRYLDLYMPRHHDRTFFVDGVSPTCFREEDVLVTSADPNHESRLNYLSSLFVDYPSTDWLMFLDSDAFPVAPIDSLLLSGSDLIAVQRTENFDLQPHPCFTLVRAGLWKEIGPDAWSRGSWRNTRGELVSDVGGELLKRLEEFDVPWKPLTRVNGSGLHPLFFALYGKDGQYPVIYHHGAGSRPRVARADVVARREIPERYIKRILWSVRRTRRNRFGLSLLECAKAEPAKINQAVMGRIEERVDFWHSLS